MKMFLITEAARIPIRLPNEAANHALAAATCPHCGTKPCGVVGSGRRPSADDRAWEADAHCSRCKHHLGIIRVETNTLFGVREDEAVLNGRCRVY